MPRHPDADAELVRGLHQLVFEDAEFRSALAAAFEGARTELENEENAFPYSSAEVPSALFKSKLAKHLRNEVNLCRVFILRRARRMETPEVHRNSIQRLTTYRGRGTIHSAAPGGQDMDFKPYALEDRAQSPVTDLNKVWDVVPMNTWHFPEASAEGDWHTVTFHSAASEEIIDEYAPHSHIADRFPTQTGRNLPRGIRHPPTAREPIDPIRRISEPSPAPARSTSTSGATQ